MNLGILDVAIIIMIAGAMIAIIIREHIKRKKGQLGCAGCSGCLDGSKCNKTDKNDCKNRENL